MFLCRFSKKIPPPPVNFINTLAPSAQLQLASYAPAFYLQLSSTNAQYYPNPNPKKTLILTLKRINMKEKIFKITPGWELFFIAELIMNFRLMDGGLMDGGSDQ